MEKSQETILSVRIDKGVVERLREYCRREGRVMGRIAGTAIERAVREAECKHEQTVWAQTWEVCVRCQRVIGGISQGGGA